MNKKYIYRISQFWGLYMLSMALIFCLGCEALFIPAGNGTRETELFEEAWTFTDREYSFFEFKNIDWDATRSQFASRVSDGMGEEALFDVLADMLFVLRDGHVNLSSPFDFSRNWTWYLNSPPNFNADILERNYFNGEQQFVGGFTIYDFGDVGYVRYSSFINAVSPTSLNYIFGDVFRNKRGVILDVRNNGGGSVLNRDFLVSRFTDTEVVAGRQRYKNGPEHDDFSDFEDITIAPSAGDAYLSPVVLLTNRSSYSATNLFTLCMKELPQVTVMGDTTGGGGGAPAFTELANGWVIRVSATQSFDNAGFNVEDGIPPDVFVQMDSTDITNGVDTILEEALEFLRR